MSAPWIAAFTALWLFSLTVAFAVLGTLRRAIAVLERLESTAGSGSELGVSVMAVVPPFEVADAWGETVTSRELLEGPSTLLLLMGVNCAACKTLATHLDDVTSTLDGVPFAVIVDAPSGASDLGIPEQARLLFDHKGEAKKALQNRATPQAYSLGRDGFVLDRRLVHSIHDLRAMAEVQREASAGLRSPDAFVDDRGR